jgi:succinoglycan biosynthesis protein ExoM
LLRRAVETARAQLLSPGRTAEILVVDNSPESNARAAMEAMAGEPGLPLRYLLTPIPNISHARNAGIAAASGDFIIFLDDDEWCEPGWLDALIGTAEATEADLVFGAVLPHFPDGPPSWDPTGRSYERRMALPTGTRIGIDHDERVSGRWIGTGNSLLRRATCIGPEPAFDPALGACGGEDYDLFVRLHAAGRHLAWCGDAVVHEVVPGDRSEVPYMRLRSFRTGQQWATITIRRARQPALTTLWIGFKAAVQLALVTGQWGWSRLFSRLDTGPRELKMAEVAGKLVWWNLRRDTR